MRYMFGICEKRGEVGILDELGVRMLEEEEEEGKINNARAHARTHTHICKIHDEAIHWNCCQIQEMSVCNLQLSLLAMKSIHYFQDILYRASNTWTGHHRFD
jgi:hypothetical protein